MSFRTLFSPFSTLCSGDDSDDEGEGEDDEDQEEDIIEPDLDANDISLNGLVGEEFLRSINENFIKNEETIPVKPVSVSRTSSRQSIRRSQNVSSSLASTIKPDHQTESSINLDEFVVIDNKNTIPTSKSLTHNKSPQNPNSTEQQFRSMQIDMGTSDKLNSLGINRKVVGINPGQNLPSPRNVASIDNIQMDEYAAAFGSRPKVPRTPDPRSQSRRSNALT